MDIWHVPLDDLLTKWTMERLAFMLQKRVERHRFSVPKRDVQGDPQPRPRAQSPRSKPNKHAASDLAGALARQGAKIQRVQARGTMASLTAIADIANPDFKRKDR